jgi:hypothetical protein
MPCRDGGPEDRFNRRSVRPNVTQDAGAHTRCRATRGAAGRFGRRHVNAELLRQVAEVYRANFDKAPAEAVARIFGVKQRMAHEYVRRARERGFLRPTTQGKKKA